MEKEWIVRIGTDYLASSDTHNQRILTSSLADAARFTKEEARRAANSAFSAFPKRKSYVARATRPTVAFDFDDPQDFVVAFGRKFVQSIGSQVRLSWTAKDAALYRRYEAIDISNLMSSSFPGTTIFAARLEAPFLAIGEANDSEIGESDTEFNSGSDTLEGPEA